jgi:hypothetical protein
MSFIINDKDLSTLLMYYGLSKKAQDAFQQTQMMGQPSSPEDQENMIKLVDNLQQQLNSKTLPPDIIVDNVPKEIHTKAPIMGQGGVPLRFGDLSSDTSFNSWIQTNKISVDGYVGPDVDQCVLLKYLKQRADYQISRATTTQIKDVAEVYRSQLEQIAVTMQCDLGGQTKPGAANVQGGQTKPGAANVQGGQGGTEQSGAVNLASFFARLEDMLPLQRDEIDLTRIHNFVNEYSKIAGSSSDPYRSKNVNVLANQIEQYIQMAIQNTNGGAQTIFRTNGLTANDLISWAQPPSPGEATRSRGSARTLADALWYVVDRTTLLLKDLYNTHYAILVDPRNRLYDLRLAIEQQVGGRNIPFGSSIAAANLSDIEIARARLPQVGI